MREPQGFSAVHSFFQRLLLVVVCLLACTLASAQQQTTTATLVGQLRVTREGSPPMRVLVRLERSGAQVGESYSDPEGKFSFDDLLATSTTLSSGRKAIVSSNCQWTSILPLSTWSMCILNWCLTRKAKRHRLPSRVVTRPWWMSPR